MAKTETSSEVFNIPSNFSRKEIEFIIEDIMRELNWAFSTTMHGYTAKTPISLSKNVAGEDIDIIIENSEIHFSSSSDNSRTMWGNAKKLNSENVSHFSETLHKHIVIDSIGPVQVVEKVSVYYELLKFGIIEIREFENEKKFLFSNLQKTNIGVDPIDFLASISQLVNAGSISRDELGIIKAAIL